MFVLITYDNNGHVVRVIGPFEFEDMAYFYGQENKIDVYDVIQLTDPGFDQ